MLNAFRTPTRIAFIHMTDDLIALNSVKELMSDPGRPHANLYEVVLWADGAASIRKTNTVLGISGRLVPGPRSDVGAGAMQYKGVRLPG